MEGKDSSLLQACKTVFYTLTVPVPLLDGPCPWHRVFLYLLFLPVTFADYRNTKYRPQLSLESKKNIQDRDLLLTKFSNVFGNSSLADMSKEVTAGYVMEKRITPRKFIDDG